MANVWLTVEKATTNVEIPPDDAEWVADQLDRIADPSDTPAAPDAVKRIREAIADPGDAEVVLSGAELDAIRRVFELEPDANDSEPLRNLQAEISRWL
jgi:hypothetical protein